MITVVYSSHKSEKFNEDFNRHIKETIGVSQYEIIPFPNFGEFSLANIYNKGIEKSKYDIVCCIHNDIKLEKGWGQKLLKDYRNNPEFAIIGKAGSCYFPESGVYWERMFQTMVGQVYHHPSGQKKWLNNYSPKLPFLVPVVTIDGLFITFDKTKIKHKFDESIGKFHFYDHGFCLPNYLDGIKLGVTSSFEITHESIGQPNQEFFESKDKFVEKYKNFLPIDLKPREIYVPEIKEKPIKNVGKVAVIIPTKGKVEMLENCVSSLYQHCNSNLFDVFIADTGSSDDEKEYIKEKILTLGNVKLIEYDYYNFAIINNDVVKKHISNEYEFLLFCNNDIKILNNVIYGMLRIFKTMPKVGTVGARLHFEDNTVQHDGIFTAINKGKQILISHNNFKNYFNYSTTIKNVIGNTAALLMIRKELFEKCDYFNESYSTCFEDVELNCKCVINGYNNYCDSSLVSYHYESQTRKNDDEVNKKQFSDFTQKLLPFINKNYTSLQKFINLV